MMFIFCSARIPKTYGIPMAMADVWKYISSSENTFCRQLLLGFAAQGPEISNRRPRPQGGPTHRKQRNSYDKPSWHRGRRFENFGSVNDKIKQKLSAKVVFAR